MCPEGAISPQRCRVGCNSCVAEYYLTPGEQPGIFVCEACFRGATCAEGVTLQTLTLERGFWRLAARSTDVHECLSGPDGFTPCLGGSESSSGNSSSVDDLDASYCASGYKGPLCQVCSNEGHYFSEPDARCLECSPPANVAGVLVAIAAGVSLAVLAVWAALRPRRDAGAWHRATILFLRRAQQKMSALGLMPKLKLLIAFYQSVTLLPNVYNVQLPPRYYEWMRIFDIIQIDWSEFTIPGQCLTGSYVERLLLRGMAPFALILAVFIVSLVGGGVLRKCSTVDFTTSRSSALRSSLLGSLPTVLFICFCLCASTASSVFATWSCVEYVENSVGTVDHPVGSPRLTRSFLRADLSMECFRGGEPTPVYTHALVIATGFVVVWAVAMPLMFLGVLIPCARGLPRSPRHAPRACHCLPPPRVRADVLLVGASVLAAASRHRRLRAVDSA